MSHPCFSLSLKIIIFHPFIFYSPSFLSLLFSFSPSSFLSSVITAIFAFLKIWPKFKCNCLPVLGRKKEKEDWERKNWWKKKGREEEERWREEKVESVNQNCHFSKGYNSNWWFNFSNWLAIWFYFFSLSLFQYFFISLSLSFFLSNKSFFNWNQVFGNEKVSWFGDDDNPLLFSFSSMSSLSLFPFFHFFQERRRRKRMKERKRWSKHQKCEWREILLPLFRINEILLFYNILLSSLSLSFSSLSFSFSLSFFSPLSSSFLLLLGYEKWAILLSFFLTLLSSLEQ